jgi:colicin import membrane protein
MMATAHARHTADGVKALFMAVAVHILVLVLLTVNLHWSQKARSQAVNVIKAVVVTEAPVPKKPTPTAEADDALKRRQIEAKRRAEALRRQKAAQRQAEIKRQKAAQRQAEIKRQKAAAAEARHHQAQKLLQEQLAAEEAERQSGLRLAAAQEKASSYISLIGDKVSSKFRRPPSSARDAFAVVRVRVTPGGRVLSVAVVRSSGDPLFDRAIENAIYLAEPLPIPTEPDVFELLREFNIDTEKF